jgi:hypothetical protein
MEALQTIPLPAPVRKLRFRLGGGRLVSLAADRERDELIAWGRDDLPGVDPASCPAGSSLAR